MRLAGKTWGLQAQWRRVAIWGFWRSHITHNWILDVGRLEIVYWRNWIA